MAYRLDLEAPVPHELRRCAAEQVLAAVAELEDGDGDRAQAVHAARKAIKKTRAVLRLARSGMSDDAFRTHNAALRDAGRTLSVVRDADVVVQTVDALAERFAGRVPAAAFAAAREAVVTGGSVDAAEAVAAVELGRSQLTVIEGGIDGWPLDGCDTGTLVEGLVRVYAQGRDRRVALKAGDAEALHEWRKRVKDLGYQQRLLRDLWPALMKAEIAESKRLAELLGEDHDLAVLRAALPDGSEVCPLVDERRAAVQASAAAAAARVFVDRPAAFERRMRRLADAPR